MSDLFTAIAEFLAPKVSAAANVVAATSAADADSQVFGPIPTVMVVPAAERWNEPKEAGLFVSTSGRIGFSCIVGMTFPGEREAWSTVREQLRAGLLGWTPDHPEAAGPIYAAGGRLLAYDPADGGKWLHAFDFQLPAQASYGIQ